MTLLQVYSQLLVAEVGSRALAQQLRHMGLVTPQHVGSSWTGLEPLHWQVDSFKFIYFIFGCVGSSLLHTGFLQLWRAGFSLWWLLLLWSTGSRCTGFSSCGARAQQLWRTGLVALRHVGSSRTRARTRVPCIGRRILNHCATREALAGRFLTTEPPGKSQEYNL